MESCALHKEASVSEKCHMDLKSVEADDPPAVIRVEKSQREEAAGFWSSQFSL